MLNTSPQRPPEAGTTVLPSAHHAAPAATEGAVLKVLVRGFNAMEHRLLEGTVKLSQRRPPRIDLISVADGISADVVMIDAQDTLALQWAALQPWLAGKAV